MYTTFVF